MTGEMHEVQKTITEAKQHMEKEKDKDKRKNNVIIYGLPESTATDIEAKKKEDLDFCLQLFNDVLKIECTKENISNVVRLGKKKQTAIGLSCWALRSIV